MQGTILSNSTIEIIGTLHKDTDDPAALKARKDTVWLKSVEIRQGLTSYIIHPKFVKKVLKLSLKLDRDADACGNPLKQQAGVTEVKAENYFPVNQNEPNFGYCTRETRSTPYILKISAPGYGNAYFIGNFLGGCLSQCRPVPS